MPSKYDSYWVSKLNVILELIKEAEEKGVSRSFDVSDITEYGERKSWYGDVVVSDEGLVKGEMAHAKSLGKILLENKMISGKFRFVITSNLKLKVEKLEPFKAIKKAETPTESQNKLSHIHPISTILSEIPVDVWNRIVQEEPEWRFMLELFEKYDFGKFAVLMTVAGLNDFQLKGKAEVAYWPEIRKLLKSHRTPKSLSELRSVLAKFYARERLSDLKLRRLNHFLSSRLAEWLWNADPKEVAENFVKIWHELAVTMKQERDAKTIAFAMKCLGIALLMAGESNFSFEKIPIPVDYRVREFTKKLGVAVRDNEDVRIFWNGVLKKLRRRGIEINMIHLDSLIWQIGVLSNSEILDYFSRLGLKGLGERMLGGDKMKLCVVPCGSRKIWDSFPQAGPTRARDVYIGSFAKMCIEYAEKFYSNSYVILSAKYGFLFPDEIIPENYNVTFNDPKTNPIGVEELRKQAEEKGLTKYDEIVVVAGSNYVDIVRKVFAGKKIVTPLKGLGGMGMMMSAMRKAIQEKRELKNLKFECMKGEEVAKIIEVVYEGGVFKPLKKIEFREGERLIIEIKGKVEIQSGLAPLQPLWAIKILSFKVLRPAKPYAEMDDYGETRRIKVTVEINGETREFIVYEFLEENKENICYVVNGYCNRLKETRNKDFYYDREGVFFPAWGISWKKETRHKFDEEETEKISKITGFKYSEKQRRFVVYIHQSREPLLLGSGLNEELAKKLILGWLICWELL